VIPRSLGCGVLLNIPLPYNVIHGSVAAQCTSPNCQARIGEKAECNIWRVRRRIFVVEYLIILH
jgi:hypothetical protein